MSEEYFGLEKKRFETRRVVNEIPLYFRFVMWTLLDELVANQSIDVDYFQIFDFSVGKNGQGNSVQMIRHSQEQPPYEATYHFSDVQEKIKAKIWIIDDGTAVVMTTPEER